MKKIILSTFILISLLSCKKEQNTEENTASKDSLSVSETPEPTKISLNEISQEELTKSLAKSNDTLYVTNFFATWCGPCMMEIPHFQKKIAELKGKPVKFTFVNILDKPAWNDKVPAFAQETGLGKYIVLFDDSKMDRASFFSSFKGWQGNGIPFTFFRKGKVTDEVEGSMSEEMLNEKIDNFLQTGNKDKTTKPDDDYVAGSIGSPEKM